MPRWTKAHHRSVERGDELVATLPANEKQKEAPPTVINDDTTEASEERVDDDSTPVKKKKKRRNRGLRLFRGGESTRSRGEASSKDGSSAPSELSANSKETKPHHKKHKGLKLFHLRNKRSIARKKSSDKAAAKDTQATHEETAQDEQHGDLFKGSMSMDSQVSFDDPDRPFYKDICALPMSCCGRENMLNCLGFPCFVAQQVMSDFAALILGEEIMPEYKPKDGIDDDQSEDEQTIPEDDAVSVKEEPEAEEGMVQEEIEKVWGDKIDVQDTESTTDETIEDENESVEDENESVEDENETVEDETSVEEESFQDDTSLDDDSVKHDTSIETDTSIEDDMVLDDMPVERFEDTMKQDWAFKEDFPVDKIGGDGHENKKGEESSLLDNEEWSFLPEYAMSSNAELEQALGELTDEEQDQEELVEKRDDQEPVGNHFEVFFTSGDEWQQQNQLPARKDDEAAKEEEKVREEELSDIPSDECPREEAPTSEVVPEFELEQEHFVRNIETFERSSIANEDMATKQLHSNKQHNDCLSDPIMFVDNAQSL